MQKTPKGIEFYMNGFLGKMFSSQTVMRKKKWRQRPREPIYLPPPSLSPPVIQGEGDWVPPGS